MVEFIAILFYLEVEFEMVAFSVLFKFKSTDLGGVFFTMTIESKNFASNYLKMAETKK